MKHEDEENKAKFEAKNRVCIRCEHEIRCECQGRQAHRKSHRESLLHGEKTHGQITRKYKVVNYVDKKKLEWNTESTEAMELEHVMSQAAQDLNDGETRHESPEAQAHEHEYVPEREEVQWTKHANTSSSRDDS